MRSPGGENEGGNIAANNDADKKNLTEKSSDVQEEDHEKKSFSEKMHEALQDWSNEDQREQEFDDTRP